MKVFWLSWIVRPIADEEVLETWPEGVKGWVTGEYGDDDRQIWCGRVEAQDADAAKEKVLSMYGRFRSQVEWRFGPEQKANGWWPDRRRFPR